MGGAYTVSAWTVLEGKDEAFVEAYRAFAAAATRQGAAREGMILRDEEDPSRYVVVRRWDDVTAIQRWTDTRPDDLAAAVLATIEEGSSDSQVLTKVADLG